MWNKLLSGRYFVTIAVTSTYCVLMLGLGYGLIKGIVTSEVFLGLLAGFTGVFGMIVQGYFNKERGTK